jgi:hypothetical protein
MPPTLSCDHAAENRIEDVHQSGRANQGFRLHVGFYEKQSREITKQVIEIHDEPLTLPFPSEYTRSLLK